MSNGIITGVRSINDALRDAYAFNGEVYSTHLLVAKSIVHGAYNSAHASPSHKTGSLRSKRKEAVFIEQSLRNLVPTLQQHKHLEIGVGVLSIEDTLSELRDPRSSRSNILPSIARKLAKVDADARSNVLADYSRALTTSPLRVSRYRIPFDVDLFALAHNADVPEQMSRLYQEYLRLEELTLRYFS